MSDLKKVNTKDSKKLKISKITINGKESSNILTAEDLKDGKPVEIKIGVKLNDTDAEKDTDTNKDSESE